MDAFAAWSKTNYALCHTNITKMLHFIALVPPLTAEAEHAFSLMNLIPTLLRCLTSDHISHCKRISKYGEFNKNDYHTI